MAARVVLREITNEEGNRLLRIVRRDSGSVKGVLGTLIASRWWRDSAAEGHRRLVISLDDPAARKWLHLSEDPRRADLLGLDHGPDGLEVAAIEVKAVEAASAEYQIKEGRIEGEAVGQVLSTRALLLDVFGQGPGADLVTTPARRELLRANAFRELSKSSYDGEARRHWVAVIEQAFAAEIGVDVSAHLVDVRIGANPASLPAPVSALAADDSPVVVTVLNEREVDELRAPEPSAAERTDPSTTSAAEGEGAPVEKESADEPPAEYADAKAEPEGVAASPASKPQPSPSVGAQQPDRPLAYLGSAEAAYGEVEEIAFDPMRPGEELPNAHISITATRLFFSQSLADPIKSIQATLVGKSSGTEAERVATEMRSMRELHCLMQNQQYRPYRRVAVTPYWRRVE
ncbi:MAG: hypothetical protein JJE35_00110 [Thermoleophilia bacterium]|nr:hypothetical protein [Thermoleophilia bacterium]